jgi:hypothetical protein
MVQMAGSLWTVVGWDRHGTQREGSIRANEHRYYNPAAIAQSSFPHHLFVLDNYSVAIAVLPAFFKVDA